MKRGYSVGFIGVGKMGSALVGGLLSAGLVPPSKVSVYDVNRRAADEAAKKFGARRAAMEELIGCSDIVFVCVKPDQFRAALAPHAALFGKKRTVVSIMAGVKAGSVKEAVGEETPVMRVMPNVAAQVGQGIAAVSRGDASEGAMEFVMSLFDAVGGAVAVPESKMDAVTALSGSGPAYVFMMIEAMIDAGVMMGLDRATSTRLSVQTTLGAAELMKRTGRSASELRGEVSSPGGTTIAGTTVLERGAFRGTVMDAVAAAWKRARELGAS